MYNTLPTPQYHDYQQKTINETLNHLMHGRHPLTIAPTGAGKTWMMMGIIRSFLMRAKFPILILCSRREVGIKIKETLVQNLGLDTDRVGLVFSGAPKETRQLLDVTISTYLSAKPFVKSGVRLVIVDEAHHSRAENLNRLINQFKEHDALISGFTATPARADSKCLLKVFDSDAIVDSLPFDECLGVTLCDYVVEAFPINSIVEAAQKSNIYRKNGEYFQSSVILNYITDTIARKFQSNEMSRAILFAVDKQHSQLLCSLLKTKGIRAATLLSGMNKTDRASIFKQFANGELDVVCNVRIFEDGVDFPECDSIIICAKFGSLSQYLQACGRSLRYQEGKVAKILDFSGATIHHGSPRIPRLSKFDSELKPKTRKCKSCLVRTPYPLQFKQLTQETFGVKETLRWWECPHCGHKHWVMPKDSESLNPSVKRTPALKPFALDTQTQQVLAVACDTTLSVSDRIDRLRFLRFESETQFTPASIYIGLRMVSPKVSDAIARAVSKYEGLSLEELAREGTPQQDSEASKS